MTHRKLSSCAHTLSTFSTHFEFLKTLLESLDDKLGIHDSSYLHPVDSDSNAAWSLCVEADVTAAGLFCQDEPKKTRRGELSDYDKKRRKQVEGTIENERLEKQLRTKNVV